MKKDKKPDIWQIIKENLKIAAGVLFVIGAILFIEIVIVIIIVLLKGVK